MHLVEAGYGVVATARRREDIETLGASLCLPLDVTDASTIAAALAQVQETFGHLDVLINNAGMSVRGAVADLSENAWHTAWAVNFMGPANLIRASLPLMKLSRRGRIINMGTLSALAAVPNMSAYTASKAALDAMSRTLQGELAPWEIFVTLVRVGLTDTALFTNAERYTRELLSPYPAPDSEHGRFDRARQKYSTDPARIARNIERVVLMSSPPGTYVIPPSARLLEALSPLISRRWSKRIGKT